MPRRDFSKVAFASTGDTVAIPDATQPDGSVSLPQGWGFDYERDNGAGGGTPDPLAKNIEREVMNGVLNEITASVGEIQQSGFPDWALTAAPYPINAVVRRADQNWLNMIANNSAEPGTAGSNWVLAIFDINALSPFRGRAIYKTAGSFSWTVPAGVTRAFVTVYGAGGGGGLNSEPGGSGGGGGGIAKKLCNLTGLTSVAVVVGAKGVGTSTLGQPGTNGGASNFGAFCSAGGGSGGTPFAQQGAGGVGSGGDENLTVGNGSPGTIVTGGAGGGGESTSGDSGGSPPINYGSGGGGRVAAPSINGADGCVIIEW